MWPTKPKMLTIQQQEDVSIMMEGQVRWTFMEHGAQESKSEVTHTGIQISTTFQLCGLG